MGQIKNPKKVKLIIGFIFNQEKARERAKEILEKRFGRIDFTSETLLFTHTDYYEKEFGIGLKREFIAFKRLILPSSLPEIKIIANRIEKKLSQNHKRLVNIDPGYLDLAKLVLASTKDFMHRIYLNKGVYAEITLSYQAKAFKSWDWTYPDYRTDKYAAIFNQIREIYAKQINCECIKKRTPAI